MKIQQFASVYVYTDKIKMLDILYYYGNINSEILYTYIWFTKYISFFKNNEYLQHQFWGNIDGYT